MAKWTYPAIFIGAMFAADTLSPVGDEPMWQTLINGARSVPQMMQAHEDAAREPSGHAFLDDKGMLKPLFGSKGYVETGLPKGPMFGYVEDQIRQGERSLQG